ncbi:MAG: HAD family phosphatase [Verrucomicrobia bacterium]|nr:HAD family phosphatase [Verrucomicrobiota bacterium]
MMKRWAAIFDWDGVIIDSSRQHEQSWNRLAEEIGKSLPPGFFLRSFGMKNEKIIPDLLAWTSDPEEIQRYSLRKEALYREIIAHAGIAPLPGVSEFLKRLRGEAVPCAIASSTPRENIECVIDSLRLRAHFQAMVCGQDVTHGKPNPEVFLLAARKLGFPPNACVVLEDAHVGIQAGLAGGMKVVGVATTHPADSLRDAHRVVHRLDELSVAEMASWFD